MNYRTRLALVITLAGLAVTQTASAQVAAPATPAGYATDSDQPLTGDAYTQATAAALKFTGQGTVTDTEAEGPRGSEVEVLLADGRQVEVQLDQTFAVVGSEADDDGPNDREGSGDDD